MPHRIIRTEQELAELVTLLGTLKLPLTIRWQQGANRSLDQNQLQWMWAGEVARQRGDMEVDEVQREWKLRYGVPILREGSDEFRATYDKLIKPRPYEDKIKAMDLIDVSSIMNVKQMTAYLDRIQRECAQQGLRLTDPEAA